MDPAARPLVLVIEDEPAIAEALQYALESEGFAVAWAALARDGLTRWAAGGVALVILDIGLPDGSGFDVLRQLRAQSEVPVMFLSARGAELDRVLGLELGADDFVSKPFRPREVCARARAILRRARPPAPPDAAAPAAEGASSARAGASAGTTLVVDEPGQRAWLAGTALDLTRYEFLLLAALWRARGRILSRANLMDRVWTDADAFDRTVDTHIKTLRAKLRAVAPGSEHILTHRGLGYSLREEG